jgi:hypothetical protein
LATSYLLVAFVYGSVCSLQIRTNWCVCKTFVSPPRNFDELSRSEYKIKSILFAGNIDLALKIVNDSLAQMLLSRVEEVAWPDGMQEVC